jgi:GH43 family beta-xylosidase
MPPNPSILAYGDVQTALDKALGTKGIKVTFKDERAAHRFASRANSFRVLDRKENLNIYHEGHSLHGRSVYDVLRISRLDKTVIIAPIVLDIDSVEFLE